MFIPVPIFEGQQLQSLLDGRFTWSAAISAPRPAPHEL
jgi:hypothetical protein